MLTHLLLALAALQGASAPRVHSICDLSQEFTFYMDGRFHTQYLKDVGRDARKDRKSTRLNSSHNPASRMPSSA
jgi:hypothetical protein